MMSLLTDSLDSSFFNTSTIQGLISGIFGAGLISGVLAIIQKRSRSPESQNELARLGNEFAAKLLEDARTERSELRTTIKELESSNSTKQETIDRLNALLEQKDRLIDELEHRRRIVARKLQIGERITLHDIFGEDAPHDVHLVVSDEPDVA